MQLKWIYNNVTFDMSKFSNVKFDMSECINVTFSGECKTAKLNGSKIIVLIMKTFVHAFLFQISVLVCPWTWHVKVHGQKPARVH